MTAAVLEHPGMKVELTVNRFARTDIEAAIRDGGLVPGALRVTDKVLLCSKVPQRRSLAVTDRAIEAVQMDELLRMGIDPYDVTEAEHNLEVYTGLNAMLRLLIGTTVSAGGTNYANGAARLCVGDGGGTVPTAVVTDTALTATSNRYNQACDSTYPSVPSGGNNSASAVLTAQSTFPTGQGTSCGTSGPWTRAAPAGPVPLPRATCSTTRVCRSGQRRARPRGR